ncbi:MAG: hypothetical protein R3Y64_09825 [Peptostreptococcaceae bacterium]
MKFQDVMLQIGEIVKEMQYYINEFLLDEKALFVMGSLFSEFIKLLLRVSVQSALIIIPLYFVLFKGRRKKENEKIKKEFLKEINENKIDLEEFHV